MVVEFDKRFLLDVKGTHDKELRNRLLKIIEQLKKAEKISEIDNLKKLERYEVYYRIKLKLDARRDLRIGLMIRKNKIRLIRCLSRQKIYKRFP